MSERVASVHLALFAAEAGESDWQLLKLTLHGCQVQGASGCSDLVGGHLGPGWERVT